MPKYKLSIQDTSINKNKSINISAATDKHAFIKYQKIKEKHPEYHLLDIYRAVKIPNSLKYK